MSYDLRSENWDVLGTIDPDGFLSSGTAEEFAQAVKDECNDEGEYARVVVEINEAIKDWTEADPDGYSDADADALDRKVVEIARSAQGRSDSK